MGAAGAGRVINAEGGICYELGARWGLLEMGWLDSERREMDFSDGVRLLIKTNSINRLELAF